MKMIKKTLGLNVDDSKYYIKLIIEAILIGLFSGLVVSLYRFGLDNSENILFSTLKYIQGDFLLTIAWFAILALMGFITALLMKWDPDSLGSGIPIVMGEVKGYFEGKGHLYNWEQWLQKVFQNTFQTARPMKSVFWYAEVEQGLQLHSVPLLQDSSSP